MTGIFMFAFALLMLILGFPVAFTFAGVALIFGVWSEGWELFAFMPFRIQSIMQNTILMAIPLFIFMGVVLQKTRLAEQLLESMAELFGRVNGGVAVSTISRWSFASSFYWRGWRQRGCDGPDFITLHAQVPL